MRTTITINFHEIKGINPERKGLDKNAVIQSLDKLMNNICSEMEKLFEKNKIKAEIIHISE